MKKVYSKLPYRKGVACIVFQKQRFLLVQKPEWPNHYWKFPQGGMNDGESELDTARRELIEEIGTDKFKIYGLSTYTNQYDWDEQSIKLAGFRWRSQIQKFVVVEFLGTEEDIKIDKKELKNYKWVELEELQNHVDHKFPLFTGYWKTIRKILEEYKKIFE